MDFENAAILISALFGGGGIIAFLKARSDIRNNNKSADIVALQETIKTLQVSYKEIQDRYQEIITENDDRCAKLADRLQYLEIEYVKQTQTHNDSQRRITGLEIDLNKAKDKIECLEQNLRKRDIEIMRLEQQNIELRKRNGERIGLEHI